MISKSFLPYQDADFAVWLDNFSKKCPTHSATLGISAADINQLQIYSVNTLQVLNDIQAAKTSLQSLTKKERFILGLLAKGFLYKEISNKLHISINTVKQHIHKTYGKLHVCNRTDAVIKVYGKN